MIEIPIVVIGKNEGARLEASLSSAKRASSKVLYVDSKSTDDSLKVAEKLGVPTLSLCDEPFVTAALARNKGASWFLERDPLIPLIQFLDGDTMIDETWLKEGTAFLEAHPDYAVISGILAEKNGEASFCKTLSKLEWEKEKGEISACGGNMLIRSKDFIEVGGFNPALLAGEDPELCLRIRLRGRKIFHLDCQMGVHDSRVETFYGLCRRIMRSGYAFHQVAMLHKESKERLFLREDLSNWIFGGIIPLCIVLMMLLNPIWGWLFLFYPLWMGKIYLQARKKWDRKSSWIFAVTCVLGKFPGFFGALLRQYQTIIKK